MDVSWTGDVELVNSYFFEQLQNCSDVISSILLICKYISDYKVSTSLNVNKLRNIALRSCDDSTSTYLWHINALIAASSDVEHLLIGLEMMFDKFLGNKSSFMTEQNQLASKFQKVSISSPTKHSSIPVPVIVTETPKNSKKCHIISHSRPFNHHNNISTDLDTKLRSIGNINSLPFEKDTKIKQSQQILSKNMMPNQIEAASPDLSSPQSAKMRHQKRTIQRERRKMPRAGTVDVMFLRNGGIDSEKSLNFTKYCVDTKKCVINENEEVPKIDSPFNVSKFEKTVDKMEENKPYYPQMM